MLEELIAGIGLVVAGFEIAEHVHILRREHASVSLVRKRLLGLLSTLHLSEDGQVAVTASLIGMVASGCMAGVSYAQPALFISAKEALVVLFGLGVAQFFSLFVFAFRFKVHAASQTLGSPLGPIALGSAVLYGAAMATLLGLAALLNIDAAEWVTSYARWQLTVIAVTVVIWRLVHRG